MNRSVANCRNCESPLAGRYCAECGQDSREPPTRLVRLLGLFASHASGVEGKVLRTIVALLAQPGLLTRAYLDGRRTRYTNPVQLYLWCTAAFILLNAYSPFVRLNPESGAVASTLSASSVGTRRRSWSRATDLGRPS